MQRQRVEDDARSLISRYGPSAYHSARGLAADERAGRLIEIDRPTRHWSKVRHRIGVLTGLRDKTDSATRRQDD